jgi:DNA invertase Pin-like site-specific DNA recombinase
MARIAYKRVSTFEQNTDRQLDGQEFNKIFSEKVSAKTTDRKELNNLIDWIREGDEVFVHSIDRLARNLQDLQILIDKINLKGASISFMKESLTFSSGDSNPIQKLMLQMMGAFAEFERSAIRERQREGIVKAKQKGVYKGRKPKLGWLAKVKIYEQFQNLDLFSNTSKVELAIQHGISRATLYKYVKEVHDSLKSSA